MIHTTHYIFGASSSLKVFTNCYFCLINEQFYQFWAIDFVNFSKTAARGVAFWNQFFPYHMFASGVIAAARYWFESPLPNPEIHTTMDNLNNCIAKLCLEGDNARVATCNHQVPDILDITCNPTPTLPHQILKSRFGNLNFRMQHLLWRFCEVTARNRLWQSACVFSN